MPILPSRVALLALAVPLLAGCGSPPESQTPLHSAYASSSSPMSQSGSLTASAPSEPSMPHTSRAAETSSNLIVKPDEMHVCFTLRAHDAEAPKTLEEFRTLTADMEKRFRDTVAKDAKIVMKNVVVSGEDVKKSDATKPRQFSVTATGLVEIALPETASYWERARLVSAAAQLAEWFNATHRETALRALVTPPELHVKAPEAHRKQLLEKWAKKAQELSKTARIGEKTLDFASCTPPADVQQRSISIEETELTLPISCEPLRAAIEK